MRVPLPVSLRWMPFYIGDYLADTMHLSTTLHGAYVLLIIAYWRMAKPLPADDSTLAAITKMSAKEWARARPTLSGFFIEGDGVWRHKRVEIELDRARRVSEARQISGKAGGKAKANAKQKAEQTTKQNPTPSQSQSKIHESETLKPREDVEPVAQPVTEPDTTLPEFLRRGATANRRGGMRPIGALVDQGPRRKRQDVADRDMATHLMNHLGYSPADAWEVVMAARDAKAESHDRACKLLSTISAENRIGWFAEERA